MWIGLLEAIVSIIGPPSDPCNRIASTKDVKEVKIYDMMGNLKFSNTYSGMEFTITNLNLKSGNYIINVFNSSKASMIRELLVVE
ncbi:MAG: T9SS type A sorting domain-containing protein [Aquaticitalea sp.]